MKNLLAYIYKYLKKYIKKIIVIICCMVIISIIGMITPLIQQRLFDEGIMRNDMENVIYYTSLLVAIFIFQKIIEFIQFVQSEHINKKLPYQLLKDTINHCLNMKIAYYKDNNFSKIINNTYKDITSITQIINSSILQSFANVLKIIGGTIGLFIINWKLAIFVISIIPIEITLSNFFSKKRQFLNKKLMKLYENFAVWLSETFNSIEILKLWNLQEKRKTEFVELQTDILNNEMQVDYIDKYSEISSSTINMIFSYGLNLLGAYFIFGNELTIGGLFAFTSYSIYVMEPISILANIIYKFSSNYPAFERFIKFFDNEVENDNGLPIKDCLENVNNITFENVVFGYTGKDSVLKQISFSINRGEKVGFIGYNGSGKSTIVHLLLRFFEPQAGSICINGINIQNISLSDYRNLFSLMNQNLFLFEGSIKNNIDINDDIPDSKIEDILSLLSATNFIDSLPERMETKVGYNGTKLSGGEKQKVVLARTLCRKAPILVLDEATASFDIEAESKFDNFISQSSDYEIIIVVSHRVDILKKLDRIYVLDQGKIIDQGSFKELEERNTDLIKILDKENENECNHEDI